jgi:hypothetical protein
MSEQNCRINPNNGDRLLAIVLALVGLLAAPAWSQTAPGGALTDFQPVTYRFEVGGKPLADAEVYQSQSTGSMLILAGALEAPVLIKLREGRVEAVNLMKVDKKSDGSVTLLQNPTLAQLGSYRLTSDRTGVGFDLNGQEAVLREKPHLLGNQNLEGMQAYSLEYVRGADAYTPSNPVVAKLREQSVVRSLQADGATHHEGRRAARRVEGQDRLLRSAPGASLHPGHEGLLDGHKVGTHGRRLSRWQRGRPNQRQRLEDSRARHQQRLGQSPELGPTPPELAINNVLVKAQS